MSPNPGPDFLIIGSQKAGTTSLHQVLSEHPDIFLPVRKEFNFFFLEQEYKKGNQYYENFFRPGKNENKICGEASPGYLCHPLTPDRIQQTYPDVKLIAILRNPIDRAYSQYWDHRKSLQEFLPFQEVIEVALEDTYRPGRPGYFSRGTYVQYLQRYLDRFPKNRLLILFFEDMISDPVALYHSLFSFLGVKPDWKHPSMFKAANPASQYRNPFFQFFFHRPGTLKYLPAFARRFLLWGKKSPWLYPAMEKSIRTRLIEFYRPWNQKLSVLLNRDLSHWNS